MSETLLQTKLFVPPLRPSLVQRPQLIEKLNTGLHGKLTLVSAPPGFGKTTLVSSWLHQCNRPFTWLSLDKEDNEPNRFFRYVIAALQEAHPELGETALSLLESPQQPLLETLLTLLINDLFNLPGQVILVLDDYHVIQELAIHEAVAFLLNNQPAKLHLVIISREDPALPLHRLRGSGQMTGIYVKDLRFSADEAALFLNETMGLRLTADEIAALERRTEGWVAGLQLAALSMQDIPDTREFVMAFAGDDRYITDYLISEVIERQPAHIRNFLRKTAVTNRFCAPLCDAILGLKLDEDDPDDSLPARVIIEQLERTNLFIIALDNKRAWYRYHHLFADFLRLRLRDLPTDHLVELHRRAGAWYHESGYIEEAIQHYLAARDYVPVAELIERIGIRLIAQGQLRKMLDWLGELPDEFIRTRPLLCVCQAWILNVTGQAAASEPLLREAERAQVAVEPDLAQHVKGLIEMIRSYQARRQNNLPGSIELLCRASENLSAGDRLVRSTVNLNLGFNYLLMGQLVRAEEVLKVARAEAEAEGAIYVSLIAMAVQANTFVAQGRLHEARALFEEAISYGLERNRDQPFPPAGYAYAGLGQLMYEHNRGEEAEKLLSIAVQLGESIADWSMVRRGLLPLAWLKQMKGETATARKLWQRALDVVQQAESERVEAQLWAHWVHLQLMQAELDSSALISVAEWAEAYRERQPDASSYQEAFAQMTLARVELVQGQVNQAIKRLDRLAEACVAGGQNNNFIKILALQALAHDVRGNGAKALEKIERALALAESEGYMRTFIDYGPTMQRLLQIAATRGLASDYVFRLVSAFPAAPRSGIPSFDSAKPPDSNPLIEPLNEKERAMLRLMAAGLTNREIAEELFLSVNTIKVYASRIYSKLDVHRRFEAVARAQELGFL